MNTPTSPLLSQYSEGQDLRMMRSRSWDDCPRTASPSIVYQRKRSQAKLSMASQKKDLLIESAHSSIRPDLQNAPIVDPALRDLEDPRFKIEGTSSIFQSTSLQFGLRIPTWLLRPSNEHNSKIQLSQLERIKDISMVILREKYLKQDQFKGYEVTKLARPTIEVQRVTDQELITYESQDRFAVLADRLGARNSQFADLTIHMKLPLALKSANSMQKKVPSSMTQSSKIEADESSDSLGFFENQKEKIPDKFKNLALLPSEDEIPISPFMHDLDSWTNGYCLLDGEQKVASSFVFFALFDGAFSQKISLFNRAQLLEVGSSIASGHDQAHYIISSTNEDGIFEVKSLPQILNQSIRSQEELSQLHILYSVKAERELNLLGQSEYSMMRAKDDPAKPKERRSRFSPSPCRTNKMGKRQSRSPSSNRGFDEDDESVHSYEFSQISSAVSNIQPRGLSTVQEEGTVPASSQYSSRKTGLDKIAEESSKQSTRGNQSPKKKELASVIDSQYTLKNKGGVKSFNSLKSKGKAKKANKIAQNRTEQYCCGKKQQAAQDLMESIQQTQAAGLAPEAAPVKKGEFMSSRIVATSTNISDLPETEESYMSGSLSASCSSTSQKTIQYSQFLDPPQNNKGCEIF